MLMPQIPTAPVAAQTITEWAASYPTLAALLESGLAPAQAALRWGLQLLKASAAADAILVFRAAAALDPNDASIWTNLGVALDRTGASAEAALCLLRALTLAPQQADTWLLLGVVRGKLGDNAGAEVALRTSIDLKPDSATAWQCLALLKERQRDYAGAIDCLGACVALGERSAAILANLGKLYYQTGRLQEAHDAYERAVRADASNPHFERMFRKARFLRDVLIGATVDGALATYMDHLDPLGAVEAREQMAWLETAAGLLSGWGHLEPAIRVCRKQLELVPSSASARYLLDVLEGAPGLSRAPDTYIAESFDAFAEGFDAQLVGVLGYDVPQQLCSLLLSQLEAGRKYAVLDAGCGTGLCGLLLRPIATALVGVDLSKKMLEMSERRAVYDELVREELTEYLGSQPGRFELIAAADVLLYFGDLGPLFKKSAVAMRPNGLLALSIELLEGEGDFRVLSSGRFAHAPGYVLRLAEEQFELVRTVDTTLRLDLHGRVPGTLFLFRRRA